MKWLVVLALVASCSSKNVRESETPAIPTSAPTESDAKPISPLTVSPCVCMKMFKPVCAADGRTYGNSCEAECNGNKTWTDGGCNQKTKK